MDGVGRVHDLASCPVCAYVDRLHRSLEYKVKAINTRQLYNAYLFLVIFVPWWCSSFARHPPLELQPLGEKRIAVDQRGDGGDQVTFIFLDECHGRAHYD